MMRDDGAFLGESLDVLGFLFQETHRDEQGEVRVLMPRLLETAIQLLLHVLPDGVAPGLDHHAAADRRDLGHVGGPDDLLVPFGIIFTARGSDGGLGFLAHGVVLKISGGLFVQA